MVGGEEEGDGPGIDGVGLGQAEGEGGGESLDTQGVDEEGSQAHLAEVAHQEGGVGAAGLDGDAAGVVEQEGGLLKSLWLKERVWVERLPSSGERMARVKESLLTSIPTSF